ncbi:hypothetical protein [Salinispora tropica]|uniref:N-acetyltransferase domain-containing protein n=1 Tax=Salinispora tropica (strain ATCC BAA-916 / DSM 44818 / JCM 13857 / NBRC 105044 / CNB-440) TaxID=369723 RepID=A4X665_SALTO|nr:hypothetical protein [Salinispora tropica]ABP54365.1 hypothetical protein Strop_1903 [Salinispora tropica CNB-440]
MNWLELIGWAGSAVLVWSLLQTAILRLRVLNLVGCVVLIGYNAAAAVWPMVGLNVVLAVINVWYLRGMLATRHDAATYEVVEVGVDDQFLAHTLRVHAADIARFNPGFTWHRSGKRSAFLVVKADEVVGVVLAHAEPGGVAQIDLDYVTQRFRDFTPGEFVYRRSQLFTNQGFRQVISPPGMIAPYYHRLGFRRQGDAYVLDLPATA